MEEHAWETSKENVQPIKRGRSARGLGETLAATRNAEVGAGVFSEQEKQLEAEIAAVTAKVAVDAVHAKELLDAYAQYFKWTRDKFPSSSEKAQLVLERATAALKDSAELKNDARFVKMWIEYADMVRTPGEIFSFMQSNKIGERIALFWIAWAFVAEKAENFKLTDQIFQKGLQRVGAVREREREGPDADKNIARAKVEKDLLSRRYQQFQRRLARHFLNSEAEAAANGEGGSAPARAAAPQTHSDRVALGGLSAGGTQRTGAAATTLQSENGPLATGAAASAASSSRARAPTAPSRIPGLSSAAAPAAPPSRSNFQIFSDAPAPASSSSSSSSSRAAPAFAVFSDEPPSQLSENSAWTQLAPQRASRKENEGRASRWNEGGLGPAASSAPAPAAASTAPAVHIPIFCDPDEDEGRGAEPVPVPESGRGFRLEMEGGRSRGGLALARGREAAGSHVDPLQRHKLPNPPPAIVPPAAPVATAPTPAPVFQVFSDEPVAAPAAPTPAPPFQVFSDEPSVAPAAPASSKGLSMLQESMRGEAAELDALLGEMGLLDAEDGTINTRLARQHIDALFCSPSQPEPAMPPLALSAGPRPGLQDSGARLFSHFNTTADLSAIKESSHEHSRFSVYTPNAHRPF